MMKTESEILGGTQSDNADNAPCLLRSFRGHKDKITQVIFNPNLR